MHQNKQPKGNDKEQNPLTDLSGSEQQLVTLIDIEQSLRSMAEKVEKLIEQKMNETTGKS